MLFFEISMLNNSERISKICCYRGLWLYPRFRLSVITFRKSPSHLILFPLFRYSMIWKTWHTPSWKICQIIWWYTQQQIVVYYQDKIQLTWVRGAPSMTPFVPVTFFLGVKKLFFLVGVVKASESYRKAQSQSSKVRSKRKERCIFTKQWNWSGTSRFIFATDSIIMQIDITRRIEF